ncbi:MAG: dihydrodipicolinate reductase C-terminal domain-containing protein, partial [Elusimicrobiota bacterium]
ARAVRDGRGDEEKVDTLSLRLAAVVGDHDQVFAGPGERLTLSHRAESRDVFASGALEAALWVARKKPGLYDMSDMLGLR